MNRRHALRTFIGGIGLTFLATKFTSCAPNGRGVADPELASLGSGSLSYPFDLADLPYSAGSLDPYIDQRTMEIHHGRHHQGYINNLNDVVEENPDLQEMTLGEMLSNLDMLPADVRTMVRNHGGGHFNHDMFWKLLTPDNSEPHGELEAAINQQFGSIDEFKAEFNATAGGVFGSGWGWLVTDAQGNLELLQTPNQDTPLAEGRYPVIGVDVWEHAYYLNYQNRRGDYLENFWNVLNWEQAEENYTQYL